MIAILAIVAIILLPFAKAIPLMFMWNWFLTPLGLPPLGLMQAAGLTLIVTLFRNDYLGKKEQESHSEKFKGMTGAEIAGYAIGQVLSTPVTIGLMALLFAWLGGFL